jgi:multidrug efflux system membrane fusion protein
VKHGADGLYAFAVTADNKAEQRNIEVGQSVDGRTVIERGLNPDDRVIVAGQYKVQDGSTVAINVATSVQAPAAVPATAAAAKAPSP